MPDGYRRYAMRRSVRMAVGRELGELMMTRTTMGTIALTLWVFGCSKSEVRHELTVVEKPAPAPDRGDRAEPKKALADEANECRENGGSACERLLERRAEVEAVQAPVNKQAWVESLAVGSTVSPTDYVVKAITKLMLNASAESFDVESRNFGGNRPEILAGEGR